MTQPTAIETLATNYPGLNVMTSTGILDTSMTLSEMRSVLNANPSWVEIKSARYGQRYARVSSADEGGWKILVDGDGEGSGEVLGDVVEMALDIVQAKAKSDVEQSIADSAARIARL